jgi:hypothetical protein
VHDLPEERRPLAFVPVLEGAAQVLGMTAGRWRVELIYVDGRLVELWPHREDGKLVRGQLDLLVLPRDPG